MRILIVEDSPPMQRMYGLAGAGARRAADQGRSRQTTYLPAATSRWRCLAAADSNRACSAI